MSTSSLLHHFGSREHLVRIAAHRTGRARVRAIDRRTLTDGVLAFLPTCADDVVDARAWLAWLELWRSDDALAEVIGNARLDERALLAETLQYRADADKLAGVTAMIDGLLTAVCAPATPLPLHRARAILSVATGAYAAPDGDEPVSPVHSFDAVRNRQRRWRERAAQ